MSKNTNARILTWVHLLRLPNLFTVPGDPIAGALVAGAVVSQSPSWSQVIVTAAAIVCGYCGGLILNDVRDYDSDLKLRPERPLPSGALTFTEARAGLTISFVMALVLAFLAGTPVFVTVLMVIVLVYAYDCLFKKHPVYGPLSMGLCRGFSFLAGASLLLWPIPVLPVMFAITAYVASVTVVASRESHDFYEFGFYVRLPLIFYLAICLIGIFILPEHSWSILTAIFLMIAGGAYIFRCQRRLQLGVSAGEVQATIGRLLRMLIVVQAVLIALVPSSTALIISILLLLIALPGAVLTSKFVSAS